MAEDLHAHTHTHILKKGMVCSRILVVQRFVPRMMDSGDHLMWSSRQTDIPIYIHMCAHYLAAGRNIPKCNRFSTINHTGKYLASF